MTVSTPFRTSASGIRTFNACPRKFYYMKVLELGGDQVGSLTVLGSVWHYAVDVYEQYDHDIGLAKRTFQHYWNNPEELGLTIDYWHPRTTHKGLLQRGLDMLDRYHELEPWRQGRLIGTEIRFEVPLGEHRISGIIDKLWMRRGQRKLEAVDFKTGSMVERRLRYNVQFTTYLYATLRPEFWEQVPGFEDGYYRFAGWERTGWWYHARNNKMFNAGGRDELDYKRLLLAVDEMARAIDHNVFPLDYSGEACGYCPYVDQVCGSEMPNPLERKEE